MDMVFEEGKDLAHIDLWKGKTWSFDSGLYEKILKELLYKNPHLQTYCNSYPIEKSSLQYIRLLRLGGCGELKHLDLRDFPSLRSLAIWHCPNFNLVTNWEVATGLRSLDISGCNAYKIFTNIEYLISLREFSLTGCHRSSIPWQLAQFNQCSKLRRLQIISSYIDGSSGIVDLKNLKDLKFLEVLSLGRYSFSSIQGLIGLQALTTLDLYSCTSLSRVPELGCLKGLTYLDMSFSSVEDVVGVEELYLLTLLDLHGCYSLKWLPFLGHLKALVYLDVWGTFVKEIPGKEDLISLKTCIGI